MKQEPETACKPEAQVLAAAMRASMVEPGYGYFDFDREISEDDLLGEAQRIVDHWPEAIG